ncbi:MAG TPA: hypothetical protein VF901_27515 [Bradyrhizobium sp.]
MTKTTIVTALRLILSLAIAGPAQAWPGHPGGAVIAAPSSVDCAWGDGRTDCDALVPIHAISVALVRKPAHPHIRKAEHTPLPPTRLPDREEDPLTSMHFE